MPTHRFRSVSARLCRLPRNCTYSLPINACAWMAKRSPKRSWAWRKCYITLDVDGMDPAYTGGTGTPVPGGLTSALQREILWHLKGVDAVGGDVVEVSPPYDPAAQTAIVAAVVAMDILHVLGEARG
jgi:arginase family enzyme